MLQNHLLSLEKQYPYDFTNMGTFRVPEPSPSPPGSPEPNRFQSMSTPPLPPAQRQVQAPVRPLRLPGRKFKQETTICEPFKDIPTSPTPEGPIPLSHLRQRRQMRSRNAQQQGFDKEPPPPSSHNRSVRADSCFNEEVQPHPDSHPETPYPTSTIPPAYPIIIDARTHQSAPTTGLTTFSLPLIQEALYQSHIHRHRVAPNLGPRATWNHRNTISHPLPPSGNKSETFHFPNPFLHLPHPPYTPAGQHFVRNVRKMCSRVDKSRHPDYLNAEFDNRFVLPWFKDSDVETEEEEDEGRGRVRRNPFGYYLGSEEEREEADMVDSMLNVEGEEFMAFDHHATAITPVHDLTFALSRSTTLHVPADGDGVVEMGVPEGGGKIQAVWDGKARTMKVTIEEDFGSM